MPVVHHQDDATARRITRRAVAALRAIAGDGDRNYDFLRRAAKSGKAAA